MNKGFLVFAQNTPTDDYVKMAYALALSLNLTQKEKYPISIVTNNEVPEEYLRVFDKVIPIPFHDKNKQTRFSTEHRWKLYHASPYDETVVLDSDILVLEDLSLFWKTFEQYDVYFTSTVKTYRGEVVKESPYRKAFKENSLPNIYTALHYFKRCDFALKYYSCIEAITKNWEDFYRIYTPSNKPKLPSMDVTAAIAAVHLDCVESVSNYNSDLVSFTHMKPAVQGWQTPPLSWQESVVSCIEENGNLLVGNFRQKGVFHYTEKSFLKDATIKKMENLWNSQLTNNDVMTQL